MAPSSLLYRRHEHWIAVAWLLLVGAYMSEATNWDLEIAKINDQALHEFEGFEMHRIVREMYAPDFVRITPYSIIQGDFQGKFPKDNACAPVGLHCLYD